MHITCGQGLLVILCFKNLILVSEFECDIEFSVPMLRRINGIICTDVGDAGEQAAFRLPGEKAAAQFLKAMREEFGLQSAGDLLIKET